MLKTGLALLLLSMFSAAFAAEDKVRLQLARPHSFEFAGYYAAQQLGYYKDLGLEVELLPGTASTNVYSEVATGKADYGVGDSSVLIERSRGRPFKIIAVILQHSPVLFLAQDPIFSLQDWLGKRVMLDGSSDELILYLQQEGVDLLDLTFKRHSYDPMDLVNDTVDIMSANSLVEPYILSRLNFPYRVFRPRTVGIDFSGDNLFTTESEINSHNDRAQAFREASLKGWDYAMKHPNIVIQWLISNYDSDHDREYLAYQAQEMFVLMQPLLIEIGYINVSRWQKMKQTYQKLGKLDQSFDLDAALFLSNKSRNWRNIMIFGGLALGIILFLGGVVWYITRMNKRLDRALKESQLARNQVTVQANQDPLTELRNRRFFQDRLETLAKAAESKRQLFALLYLDLDRFKNVNDLYGHHWGDHLIKEVSKRLLSCLPKGAELARIGGDEFTVLISNDISRSKLKEIAQTILREVEKAYLLNQNEVYISVSIGITLAPLDSIDPSALMQYADEAMYEAKSKGRNRWCFFSFDLHQKSVARQNLTNDLRQALVNKEFFLQYQPIVDLKTNRLVKFEALIRWQHPTRGLVPPDAFIPVAEESGLISDIGDFVFKQSLLQLAKWQSRFSVDLMMSINISPYQLAAPDLHMVGWFDFLHKQDLPRGSVSLEITENILMHHTEIVSEQLLAFRDHGINVALDDFGTGYSALSYLNRLDIDYIKIDRSFVKDLAEGAMEKDLCEAIISMAHKLNLKVIAEGIETTEQANILQSFGCDLGQGYLFAKPLPVEDAEALLASQSINQ